MTAGYLTLATGADKYLQMAVNLALSIKLNDPSRPICLVHDKAIKPTALLEKAFDRFVLLPEQEDYVGCLNKIRLYEASPFAATLYVDSDCYVVKNDMDRHWARFSGQPFNLAGTKRTSGRWYHFDIADICSRLHLPYVVEMNSGVFYFERTERAEAFFHRVNKLFREERNLLGFAHQGRFDQFADEPFIGTTMGIEKVEPISYVPEEGSIMVTTLGARHCRFDPTTHESVLDKPTGFVIPRIWAKSWQPHSPSIAHFVGLKPRAIYTRIANQLRAKFGFPQYRVT